MKDHRNGSSEVWGTLKRIAWTVLGILLVLAVSHTRRSSSSSASFVSCSSGPTVPLGSITLPALRNMGVSISEPEEDDDKEKRAKRGSPHGFWERIGLVGWALIASVALVGLAGILYLSNVSWAVDGLDRFWNLIDASTERLKVLASLLPLAVVLLAYHVYRSDRWWSRAQWALDAATEDDPDGRQEFGMNAIKELLHNNMAQRKDRMLFASVVQDIYGKKMDDVINSDPELAAMKKGKKP